MDFTVFLKIVSIIFRVLAWPPVSLMYPLYASIRAIEGNATFNYQQCLTYWVLFSISTIMELVLAKILIWFPIWPYVKGTVTVLLAIHRFGGASYVYFHFIRPYTYVTSPVCDFLHISSKTSVDSIEVNDTLEASEIYRKQNGTEEELEVHVFYESQSIPKKVQQEWSCAICLVTTTCEKDLKRHLQGKKHKATREELKRTELIHRNFVEYSFLMNLESWSYLLNPITRSITWCKWRKPDFGWTKLNTDGSIDRENSGLGGLFRNHNGDPICGYVSKALCDDIFLVELWAIWRGLVLALGLGIEVIWVESDSMSVVKSINKEQSYRSKASSGLEQVWKLLMKFKKYKVSHSWRETNRAADHLAKMDLKKQDVVIWPIDFPERLNNIIKDDAQGRRYRRC